MQIVRGRSKKGKKDTNKLKLKHSINILSTHTHTPTCTLEADGASRAIRLEEVRGCEIAAVWDFLNSHNLH